MEILLKLSIPDKTIKDIDELSEKLGWEYHWWDVVSTILYEAAKRAGGKIKFVKIVSKKRFFRSGGKVVR